MKGQQVIQNYFQMRRLLLLFIGYVLIWGMMSCSKQSADKITISLIPKGTSHVFWQSVHAGAIKASKELGVNIVWIGPDKEDDRNQQIALVDNQVMNQVSAIALAPLDEMALRRPVKNAVAKNIPVVIFDSGLKDSEDVYSSFIATDNREGGRIAGRQLGQLLKGKGKVIMLRYQEGNASTDNREEGFLETIKGFSGIEVTSDEQYGGASKASAQQASENLLLRFRDADGQLTIDGIFCPNESTTYGMLQALRRSRLAGKVRLIGFDSSNPLIKGLRAEEIDGLVIQDPFKMAYLSVRSLVQVLKGEKIEKRIDTGVTFITNASLEKPEVQELIDPDLDKWQNLE